MTGWTNEEKLEAEPEDTIASERSRRGPAKNSFTVLGREFFLRADRSRMPARIRDIANDLDDPDDPEQILAAYREIISTEIRYADKQRWALVEGQLDMEAARELVAWILAPAVVPISKERASNINRKALGESAVPT